MVKESLIRCVDVLLEEKIITKVKRKKLVEGIKIGDKKAFFDTSKELQKLAQKAYREVE